MGGVTAALTDMGFEVTSGESADPYKAKGSLLTPKGLIGLGLQVRLSTNQQTRLCLTCLLSGVRSARRRRRCPFSPGAQARCVHASLVLSVLITQKIQHHYITYVHKSLYLSVSLCVIYITSSYLCVLIALFDRQGRHPGVPHVVHGAGGAPDRPPHSCLQDSDAVAPESVE